MVDVNRGKEKDCSNCKKNAGKEASTSIAGHPGAFWGRQAKQVPGTHVCPELLGFCYLIGPSLVMRRETRKVAMVARSRVLGKVLR